MGRIVLQRGPYRCYRYPFIAAPKHSSWRGVVRARRRGKGGIAPRGVAMMRVVSHSMGSGTASRSGSGTQHDPASSIPHRRRANRAWSCKACCAATTQLCKPSC